MEKLTKEFFGTLAPPAAQEKTNGHQSPKTSSTKRVFASDFDMPAFLTQHHIETRDPESYQGGQKWLLAECPFCHNTDRCACVYKQGDGTLGFSCSHNSCKQKYHWHDFREHFEPGYDEQQKEESQAEKLVALALQSAEKLFMTPKGDMYIRLRVNSHIETLPISERGGAFKRWLVYHYRDEYGAIPNANALTQAITALEAQAQWGGTPQQDTYIRVAFYGGNIYLDLANAKCEAVEITAQGWKITTNPPVCFRHPEGMLPLPEPMRGGSLDALRPFVNTQGNAWVLLKAYILGMMHPTGPYPILNLSGEKGTAKSSTARLVRTIIDPHQAPLRREPKDDQAFAIMAQNNYVIAFDNLSYLSSRFSDLMCTLSTRGGDAFRKHYSNDEECIFDASRPQIFTGIEDLATRGDLIDRCINIKLQPIGRYKDEATLKREFEAAHPLILGALLDAVSLALCNAEAVKAEHLPRMADFAKWVLAAEEYITDEAGTFLPLYRENLDEGIETEIEASAVGQALIKFMANADIWESTASDLLAKLKTHVDEEVAKQRSWPKNARALSGCLKRLAPSLRAKGMHIAQKRTNEGKFITIAKLAGSDANDPKSDANFEPVTQKNSDLRHPKNENTSDFTTIVTQSDANIPSIPSPVQSKKEEKREERGVMYEKPEKLRYFASLLDGIPIEQESDDKQIADILAQLKPGKFVVVADPDGAGLVKSVGKDSVDLDHYGKIKKYTGAAILGITP